MFLSMGDGGSGTGRREEEIASRPLPHGSVEADIHVEKTALRSTLTWHKLSLPHTLCIGEIMDRISED